MAEMRRRETPDRAADHRDQEAPLPQQPLHRARSLPRPRRPAPLRLGLARPRHHSTGLSPPPSTTSRRPGPPRLQPLRRVTLDALLASLSKQLGHLRDRLRVADLDRDALLCAGALDPGARPRRKVGVSPRMPSRLAAHATPRLPSERQTYAGGPPIASEARSITCASVRASNSTRPGWKPCATS